MFHRGHGTSRTGAQSSSQSSSRALQTSDSEARNEFAAPYNHRTRSTRAAPEVAEEDPEPLPSLRFTRKRARSVVEEEPSSDIRGPILRISRSVYQRSSRHIQQQKAESPIASRRTRNGNNSLSLFINTQPKRARRAIDYEDKNCESDEAEFDAESEQPEENQEDEEEDHVPKRRASRRQQQAGPVHGSRRLRSKAVEHSEDESEDPIASSDEEEQEAESDSEDDSGNAGSRRQTRGHRNGSGRKCSQAATNKSKPTRNTRMVVKETRPSRFSLRKGGNRSQSEEQEDEEEEDKSSREDESEEEVEQHTAFVSSVRTRRSMFSAVQDDSPPAVARSLRRQASQGHSLLHIHSDERPQRLPRGHSKAPETAVNVATSSRGRAIKPILTLSQDSNSPSPVAARGRSRNSLGSNAHVQSDEDNKDNHGRKQRNGRIDPETKRMMLQAVAYAEQVDAKLRIFAEAVDADQAPSYCDIILQPMDLATIR